MTVFSFLCLTTVTYVLLHGGIVSSSSSRVYGATPNEQVENQAPQACCQSGMHGVPGQHGLPGSKGDLGVKGDKGDSCQCDASAKKVTDEAIIDAQGPPGPKGSMGMAGLRGESGPEGPMGPEGPRGGLGAKGETGEPTSISPRQKSAFTAVNTQNKAVSIGDALGDWDDIVSNKGNDFDQISGKFTCRVPGTYVFMFSCAKFSGDGPVCWLKKTDQAVVGVYMGSESQFHQSSNGAILDLVAGDKVWIEIIHRAGTVGSSAGRYTSFSGYLLFEE